MVIVLRPGISAKEKGDLKAFLSGRHFKISEVRGEEETVLAAVGKLSLDVREVELLPGVSRVIPVSKPYKLASRQFKPDDTVVEIRLSGDRTIRIGGNRLCVMAGPFAIESKESLLRCAAAVAASGAVILRGGAFPQDVSPYSRAVPGKRALGWLKVAGEKYGMPVCAEAGSVEQVALVAETADIIQIGPGNMANVELLRRAAAAKKPVILCRGHSATVEELLLSAECLLAGGAKDVILCECGIRSFEPLTRNTLDVSSVPMLKELTHLPVIADPSAAIGVRDKIPALALAAVASGADGLALDVFPSPETALFGAARSLSPVQFDKVLHDIQALSPVVGKIVDRIPKAQGKGAPSAGGGSQCAFCGARGAYAEQAVTRYFDGTGIQPLPVGSFADIFRAVTDGTVRFGMVPIENSLAGSVYQNYDNFLRFEDAVIVGAVTLNIRHSLLAVQGASLSGIRRVYSHPQALSQCRKFLGAHTEWTQTETVSTSGAAEFVRDKGSRENAAIASAVNAPLYGLSVIAQDIEDDPGNFTRFVVISRGNRRRGGSALSGANMASFLFKIQNKPGALVAALKVFESYGLNLTRLESRPISGEPWRYWFYADADMHGSAALSGGKSPSECIGDVLRSLSGHAEQVRLLGIYSEIRF